MPFTLADEIVYTAVKLSGVQNGQNVGSGTGFFWTVYVEGGELNLIITNKHVVGGCDQVVAVCHQLGPGGDAPGGAFTNCTIGLGQNVIDHPDAAVDLCAIFFGPILNEAHQSGAPLFFKTTTAAHVPTNWEQFDSIEDVVMIGCPRGIYDEFNNLPIVRRGITATPLRNRYGGRDEFMVDMACFPGSSGSPVFIMQHSWFDRENQANVLGGRFFLLGVLYSGPLITNEGQIILSQQPRVEVAAMMHLGQVIRSSALLTLEDHVLLRTGQQRAPHLDKSQAAPA